MLFPIPFCSVLCCLKFSEGGTFISRNKKEMWSTIDKVYAPMHPKVAHSFQEIRKKCGQQLTKYMHLCIRKWHIHFKK